MERITKGQLESVLKKPGLQLRRRLPNAELKALGIMLEKTARRYPSQENADSMKEYLADFEKLALKYSLQKIESAIESLRITPGQSFFPRPDEVAAEIVATVEQGRYAADIAEGKRRRAAWEAEQKRIAPWRARLIASGLSVSEFIALEDAETSEAAQ